MHQPQIDDLFHFMLDLCIFLVNAVSHLGFSLRAVTIQIPLLRVLSGFDVEERDVEAYMALGKWKKFMY